VTGDGLVVVVGDGRVTLAGEPGDAFDLVVGDAFAGPAVPWHLTTREFLDDVRRVLRPGGIYVLNVIDYPPLALARAEMATLREVFGRVAFLGPGSRLDGSTGGNLILLASDAPFPDEAIRDELGARGDLDVLETDAGVLDAWIGDAPILTDDFAPTDQLLTRFR
jgi:spermidine synthase